MEDEDTKKIKRTHTFEPALLKRLELMARKERRKVSEQLAILLEDALDRAEKRAERAENEPGPGMPAPSAVVATTV
jgi:hypothetical protein